MSQALYSYTKLPGWLRITYGVTQLSDHSASVAVDAEF
jgi:hypothetical protein